MRGNPLHLILIVLALLLLALAAIPSAVGSPKINFGWAGMFCLALAYLF
jgi:hypothetical protein